MKNPQIYLAMVRGVSEVLVVKRTDTRDWRSILPIVGLYVHPNDVVKDPVPVAILPMDEDVRKFVVLWNDPHADEAAENIMGKMYRLIAKQLSSVLHQIPEPTEPWSVIEDTEGGYWYRSPNGVWIKLGYSTPVVEWDSDDCPFVAAKLIGVSK